MELLLVALAPFILFALFFDRFDFEKAEAAPESAGPRAEGQDRAGRPAEPRRTGARIRRDRAGRAQGAASWN